MIDFILQKIRSTAVADTTLFNIIGTRFFPQNVNLESDTNIFPLVAFSLVGGFPDRDNYGSDVFLLETIYASENSLDESVKIYDRLHTLINTELFSDSVNSKYFQVREDTKPFDGSGLYGDKFLYVYSNIWKLRTIGT